jgi:cytochrome P450
MLESRTTARLYPPRIEPARRPLRFPHILIKLLNNSLEIVPEQAYEEAVVIAPGPPRVAFFTGPEAVKALLQSRQQEFPKSYLQNKILEPLFGKPLNASEGHEWRWQRGVVAPLFRHEELLQYGQVMTASAEATVMTWRTENTGEIRAVNRDMLRAVFRVISSTMLVGGAREVVTEIEKGHTEYFASTNWWVLYTLLGLPSWLPRPGGTSMREREIRLRKSVEAIISARRDGAGGSKDLLGRMLASFDPETAQKMSDRQLVDNTIAFLVGGYDTTALSLTWALYLISQSPEWETRILEEVDRVAGSNPVGSEHFEQLIVTQQVYNEALRLYPTAPMIGRDILDDVEIEGVRIPAGTVGIIPIYTIHRHRQYWDDPDLFDPDRFSPENSAGRPRYQFLPFGAGPRICMGAAFATLGSTIMLASFVRAAHFESAPGFRPQPTGRLFLFSKNGMPLRVTMRN